MSAVITEVFTVDCNRDYAVYQLHTSCLRVNLSFRNGNCVFTVSHNSEHLYQKVHGIHSVINQSVSREDEVY